MDRTKRIEQLKSFLENDPDDSFIRFALAQEYSKIGTLKAALDEYLYILKHEPSYIGLYYHLGKLYEELGEKHKALHTYDAGIEESKKVPDFHAISELQGAKTNLEIEL